MGIREPGLNLIVPFIDRLTNVDLRIPFIPGLTDTPGELESMARFAASLPAIRQVNLLPYHRTGLQKFSRLGKEYPLPDLAPPTDASMEAAAAAFSAHGLRVQVGG